MNNKSVEGVYFNNPEELATAISAVAAYYDISPDLIAEAIFKQRNEDRTQENC
ncbi:hypothetical protein [Klebsiella oxytoca]|uniref:hypothetical protein n=1 Tax=Klebsiella oxytoca TaxID=571 RepID=UPI001CCD6665|nr:hypothetical protein [Klebsiella oxytoca]